MVRLSSYVQLKRGYNPQTGGKAWYAYWRGTMNRVKDADGYDVPGRSTQTALRWDLTNYAMEQGVMIEAVIA